MPMRESKTYPFKKGDKVKTWVGRGIVIGLSEKLGFYKRVMIKYEKYTEAGYAMFQQKILLKGTLRKWSAAQDVECDKQRDRKEKIGLVLDDSK